MGTNEEKAVVKSERPETKAVAKKTYWINFDSIAEQINREPQHILDFFVAEMSTTGHFGGDGNLILNNNFKNKHIMHVYRTYLNMYVKCENCGHINSKMVKDQNTRLTYLDCNDCHATRTVEKVSKVAGYHHKLKADKKAEAKALGK